MMDLTSRKGFSAIEVVIGIFIVAAIAGTGYLAYNRMKDANKAPTAAEQATQAVTPTAPAVNSSSDLDDATKTLDATNLDASVSDSTELDSEVGNF